MKFHCVLNMIVKNEAHCIRDTLNSIIEMNKRAGQQIIDGYLILDTNSTDNTKQVITDFFHEHKIPGKIVDDEDAKTNKKFDFGIARTKALNLCKGKSKYAFVFDADDLIHGNPDWPKTKEDWDQDVYTLNFGSKTETSYQRNQIFKVSCNWRYVGFRHEFPECDVKPLKSKIITGDYYVESRRLGARSKVKNKYLLDAELFDESLKEREPLLKQHQKCQNKTLVSARWLRQYYRDLFYCANSYFDHVTTQKDDLTQEDKIKYLQKSYDRYTKRMDYDAGWIEEMYMCYFRLAEINQWKEKFMGLEPDHNRALQDYVKTHKIIPTRNEALCRAMHLLRSNGCFKEALGLGLEGMKNKYESTSLFAMKVMYGIQWLMMVMEIAFIAKEFQLVVDLGLQYLKANGKNPEENKELLEGIVNAVSKALIEIKMIKDPEWAAKEAAKANAKQFETYNKAYEAARKSREPKLDNDYFSQFRNNYPSLTGATVS